MNGFFTIEESRNLTLEELQHYIGVGLVAGLEAEMVSDFLAKELEQVHVKLKSAEAEYQDSMGKQVDLENQLESQDIQVKELIGDLQDAQTALHSLRKEYLDLKFYFEVWSSG